MKFTNTWTGNWENAFRGLRHPFESYEKSDSDFGLAENDAWLDEIVNEVTESYIQNWDDERVDPNREEIEEKLFDNGVLNWGGKSSCNFAFIGAKDMELAQRMVSAGTPNDKFLRQIFVSVDITAPLYWWKEMDTYKVGTTANSTSTMHKLASTPITKKCFEKDDFQDVKIWDKEPYGIDTYVDEFWNELVDACETLRQRYNETKDIRYWKELIRILPESWLQTRTWTANYSVLRNIIHWRKGHKLTEWKAFLDWAAALPYANELLLFEN